MEGTGSTVGPSLAQLKGKGSALGRNALLGSDDEVVEAREGLGALEKGVLEEAGLVREGKRKRKKEGVP